MRCLVFAALLGSVAPRASLAQQVPGRDLLAFPLGALAEPAALAILGGDGLRNPALILVQSPARFRVGAGALHTPADQGVSGQLLTGAVRVPRDVTVGLTIVRASVNDLRRTLTDPTDLGDITYATTLLAATVAQRRDGVAGGLSVRYRIAQVDERTQGEFSLDAGVSVDDLLDDRVRVGASTFLWQPGGADAPTVSAAIDGRVLGDTAVREARLGYGFTLGTPVQEHYAYASGRYGPVDGRAGIALHRAYDHRDWRMRLGLGLHHARYVIAVAREENGAGLGPVWQFALTALLP